MLRKGTLWFFCNIRFIKKQLVAYMKNKNLQTRICRTSDMLRSLKLICDLISHLVSVKMLEKNFLNHSFPLHWQELNRRSTHHPFLSPVGICARCLLADFIARQPKKCLVRNFNNFFATEPVLLQSSGQTQRHYVLG